MPQYQLQPYTYPPKKLSLDGVTLAAERTSNSFHVAYRDNMNVFVELSARTTATAVLVKLEAYDEFLAEWIPVQSVNISAGTGALSDFQFSKSVSGVDTFNALFALDRAYDLVRLKVSGTSGAAGDVVSVSARVS